MSSTHEYNEIILPVVHQILKTALDRPILLAWHEI